VLSLSNRRFNSLRRGPRAFGEEFGEVVVDKERELPDELSSDDRHCKPVEKLDVGETGVKDVALDCAAVVAALVVVVVVVAAGAAEEVGRLGWAAHVETSCSKLDRRRLAARC